MAVYCVCIAKSFSIQALSSLEQHEHKSPVHAAPLDRKSRTLRPRTKDVFDVRFKHFTGAGPSLLGRERLTASWSQWRTEWTSLKTDPVSGRRLEIFSFPNADTRCRMDPSSE